MTLGTAIGQGQRFLDWWWSELKQAAAALARHIPDVWGSALVLEWRGGEMAAFRRKGGERAPLGVLPPAARGEDLAAAVRAFGKRAGTRRLVLSFSAEAGLRRTVTLPAAARHKLRQIMTFELDRLTPWPADAAYFSAEIVGRGGNDQQMNVGLAVLPRLVAQPVLERLSQAKLMPDSLELAGPEGMVGQGANLLGPADRPRRFFTARLAVGLLAAALAVDWLGSGLLLYLRGEEAATLHQRLAEARREVEAVGRLRDELDRFGDKDAFLAKRRADGLPLVIVLERLSRLVPDNTWLIDLRLTRSEASLSGYTKDASALVPLIEQSRLFSDVRFLAPVVRDVGDSERFQIGARIAPVGDGNK